MLSSLGYFFLLNSKYHLRNELLRFTRCDEQTVKPLKHTSKAKKVKKHGNINQSNLKPFCFDANMTSSIDTNL